MGGSSTPPHTLVFGMDLASALKESQARELALLVRLGELERKSLVEKQDLIREKEALIRKHESRGNFLPFRMPFAGESDP